MATKKVPIKKQSVTKASAVNKTVAKNSKKVVTKKATSKKPATPKKTPTKKKHIVRRILDFKLQGWVSRKTLIISGAVVVLAVGAFAGYNIWQDSSANAGGVCTLGRSGSGGRTSTTKDKSRYNSCLAAKKKASTAQVKKTQAVTGWTQLGTLSFVNSSNKVVYSANVTACKVGTMVRTRFVTTAVQPGGFGVQVKYNFFYISSTKVGDTIVLPLTKSGGDQFYYQVPESALNSGYSLSESPGDPDLYNVKFNCA